ncbi:glycosyltransferase family 2 protein [Variovorax terrae]|uniref:Glycosyltransferase family 2 protein n=1 Tax=Variovorax terrae TaxID=2923278 RepID=A0A9X1W191_9BURK|nr:glycosyltransferase family 2 protein [Variovorax terrae]
MIPALNEAASIAGVVAAACAYGRCIVVDDGSSDGTAEAARAAGALVVSHPANRGYDAALDSGFREADRMDCEVVITLDADGQHTPELLVEFVAKLKAGAAVVLGVRDRKARLAEHVFAWYTRRFGIADPLCGMKAYRIDVYRALGHFDAYRSIGSELALFAARNGYRLASVPVKVRDRVGEPRFGRKLSANLKIFRALALSL